MGVKKLFKDTNLQFSSKLKGSQDIWSSFDLKIAKSLLRVTP